MTVEQKVKAVITTAKKLRKQFKMPGQLNGAYNRGFDQAMKWVIQELGKK